MHTPDGLITSWVCVLMLLLSAIPIVLALRNLRKDFSASKAASIAGVAAIIFLAQMLNFPIAEGTSGHLVGAAFALILLGLDGAVVAMASVLLIQAFVFGDGGALALGANIFNMGILGIYSADFVITRLKMNRYVKTFAASWVSVIAGSIAVSAELALSGTSAISLVLPAMAITHSIIGIGEGLLTILMVSIFANRLQNPSIRWSLAASGVFFLFIAILLPLASGSPDGLESVAIRLGFFSMEKTIYSAPVPEYTLSLFAIPYLAIISAAAIGYILTYILAYSSVSVLGCIESHRN